VYAGLHARLKKPKVSTGEDIVPKYYPVMLDIRDRQAIVIGGNRLAAEKAAALVASGARVKVIHPKFCAALLAMSERGELTLHQKSYEPGDLAGAFVVVAVASDKQLIEAIWQETQERGQPVNIADVPRYCSFILPSILRRGQLTLAVSTEGASPGMAKRIRHQLEETFPPAYGAYVDLAALARTHLRRHGVSYEARDAFVRDFMTSPILDLLASGKITQALTKTVELLQTYGIEIQVDELLQEFTKEQGDVASKL
jgi:precorrin-2 dehydrogenase / sirohydrochlorin ferrochelatase